jgi:hypothetical protein
MWEWTLGIPLGVLVTIGVIVGFYGLLLTDGEE